MRGGGVVGARQADREAQRSATATLMQGLGAALSTGDVSGEHVDSVSRHLTRLDDDHRGRVDVEAVVDRAKSLPPETFDRWLRRTVDAVRGDHGLSETNARRERSEFRHWFDHTTGMGRFAGSLDPERYERLCSRIEHRMAELARQSEEAVRKNANLAAEALIDLVDGRPGRGGMPSVTVLVDERTLWSGPHAETIAETENGHELPPESVARLCCDATLRRVTLDRRGLPIDVGRRHRTATDAQWAALKAIHRHCAWVGCSAPITWCQAHHIREWERGGPTDLGNLVPLCNRHHHLVHEGRWRITLGTDRTLRIDRPDGTRHATARPFGRSSARAKPP